MDLWLRYRMFLQSICDELNSYDIPLVLTEIVYVGKTREMDLVFYTKIDLEISDIKYTANNHN